MNKLIIIGTLMFGVFILPSIVEENDSIEGRLEIISPKECVGSKKYADSCSKLLNLNSNCFDDEEFKFEFISNTHIEFLTVESDIKDLRKLKIEIDNIKTEHIFENEIFWLDINKNVTNLKISFENICGINSLEFYGRMKS